jgi:uncharacterized protein (DUF1778 family)
MPLPIKDERIDLRVPLDQKQLIERAAALAGQSISTFVLGTTLRQAREVISSSEMIDLSNRERDLLLAALDNTSAKPNAALRRAAERRKALIG